MNIVEILCAQATGRPDAPALAMGSRRDGLTFAALQRAAARTAALLGTAGIRRGDAALVFQQMSVDLYVILVALFQLGAVAMFVDPSAGWRHIDRCCALNPPTAFLAGPRGHLLRLLSPAVRRIPLKFSVGMRLPGAVPVERAARTAPMDAVEPCGPDAPALLTFTSGSTGEPKAAIRSHGFLLAQHRVLEKSLGLRAGQVDLTTLPIFALANLASGVTSVIPDVDLTRPGLVDAARLTEQIDAWQPVRTVASPALLERLARHAAKAGRVLPSFEHIFTGGAPVHPRLLDELQAMSPCARITAVYGSTEAEPIAHVARSEIEPADLEAMLAGHGLLAGSPVPAIDLRIHEDLWGTPVGPYTAVEFAAQCLQAGRPGEIVVSGDHVLPGYLRGHGETETKFTVDGRRWHRTGDAGYLDARGRLWLLGRCAARVQDDRGVLYPFAVECSVLRHEAVHRAALLAHRGRRILAVEPLGTATKAELEEAVVSVRWAQLDEILTVPRIPVDRRHNAKVDYPALRALLERRR